MEMEALEKQKLNEPYLDSKLVHAILKAKGVVNLHHANTVKTALTFIEHNALLSRHFVETNGLRQTWQYTDEKDKKLGIWDAIFFDGLDLHKKFAKRNIYGPILFLMQLDILLQSEFPKVRVTKTNPVSWKVGQPEFYDNIENINAEYLTGNELKDGRVMFLLDSPEKSISLSKYCQQIVIDDPRINLIYPDKTEHPIAVLVKTSIENALADAAIPDIPVSVRHPDLRHCGCYNQYKWLHKYDREKFDMLFSKK